MSKENPKSDIFKYIPFVPGHEKRACLICKGKIPNYGVCQNKQTLEDNVVILT